MSTSKKNFNKRKLSLSGKLILGILTLSVLGLVGMFLIVNMVLHGIIYESALGIAERDKLIYAREIDEWFMEAVQTVRSMATALKALPSVDYFPYVAEQFVADYDFVENVFIGFADGSVINGIRWRPDIDEDVGSELDGIGWGPWEYWSSTDRPWYLLVENATPYEVKITSPYLSMSTGNVTAAMAMWVPGLQNVGASVGFSVSIEEAVSLTQQLPVAANGYLMIIGADNEIIFHPHTDFELARDGDWRSLSELPNGEYFINNIALGERAAQFEDEILGTSYFIVTPLETVGWTLAAVLPVEITRTPVMQSMFTIIITFAAFLIALFVFITIFVSLLTRSMEDSHIITAKLQAMLDASPLLSVIFKEDGTVLETNKAALELFEISDKQEYIDNMFSFTPEFQPNGKRSSELILKDFAKAIKTGEVIITPYWMNQTKSGDPLPVEITLVPFKMGGENRIIGYARDLRPYFKIQELQEEEKRKVIAAEVAEESNRAKSRFLAGMSHEIRTPITAVMGIAEIELQNPELSPHLEEVFAKIHNSSISLLGIINDILDISKIEAGKMELFCKEYETPNLLADTAQLFVSNLSEKEIEFKIDVAENLPRYLMGDVLRIGQILNNLLSNAFKYTIKGTVRLSLLHEPIDKENTTLVIFVSDTGMGMTREQLDFLYHEYEQFHVRETGGVSGVGLGMSIVYNLVQMMNAQINTESEVGLGTNVCVRIPQKIASPEVLGEETARNLRQFKAITNSAVKRFKFTPECMSYGRVLIVDDTEANLYVTKGLLSFYEISVDTCDNGYTALEMVKLGEIYDIIFMDQTMPGISGTETMLKMREAGYTGIIIALTANALIGQAEEFIQSGFDGFISKPIKTEHLNALLNKHIRDKHPVDMREAASMPRQRAEDIENFQSDATLQKKLRYDFVASQKNTFSNLTTALKNGDATTAYRLAHSLKGLAGLIREHELAASAEYIEKQLAGQRDTPQIPLEINDMTLLESQLKHVMQTIGKPAPKTISPSTERISKANVQALFEQLTPLLHSKNADALELLPELKKLPEAAIIAKQIENFEFAAALGNLELLKQISDC